MSQITKRFPLLVLITVFLFLGCGGPQLGGLFQPVKEFPPENGLVYIYRPTMKFAYAETYNVWANDKKIGEIIDSSYFTYVCPPGKVTFTVERTLTPKRSITIDIAPGQMYFLRVLPTRGTVTALTGLVQPNIEPIHVPIGKEEIIYCRQMQ
jgi:hypothetical protein